MMQTEVGEVSEPFVPHRGSSSTMPNKFNPISCVYIHALATTVRQHSAALMDAMVEDHERSTGPWEIGKLFRNVSETFLEVSADRKSQR